MTAYDHSSGYTYGTDAVPTSPLTLEDLRQIEAAAHVQPRDAELLSRAEPVLAPHAMEMQRRTRRMGRTRHRSCHYATCSPLSRPLWRSGTVSLRRASRAKN